MTRMQTPQWRALRQIIVLGICTGALAGCGYFNSMYNARRSFADAERAQARGQTGAAQRAYGETIERAAVSYRRYPQSRWADDALLLIARSQFALEQDARAAAASATLLTATTAPQIRAAAHAYRGAALFRLQRRDSALIHLDSAVALAQPRSSLASFAHLWRARIRFQQGRVADAWADLDQAGVEPAIAFDASLEGAAHAAELRDSLHLAEALTRLARARYSGTSAQPVLNVLQLAAARLSPGVAFHSSHALDDASWPAAPRAEVTVARARLAAIAGDTAAALRLSLSIAESMQGATANHARRFAGILRLAHIERADELESVRVLLLPAFDDVDALALMRTVRVAQILVHDGAAGSALSLFAAAELARDELYAPRLARTLFLAFAAHPGAGEWAGKAVLAAHALARDAETDAALDTLTANVYIRTVRGDKSADITPWEERLARGLIGMRADAFTLAVQRDVVVGRALSELDSTRAVARTDSVRIACGTLIDTLRLKGIRADSTRGACLRGDSARVAFVLRADTAALLADSTRAARPGLPRVRRDTTAMLR